MDKFDLVRFTDNDFELDVRADSENETVWLTQEEIAILFDASRSTVTYHINNIFSSNELEENTSGVGINLAKTEKGHPVIALPICVLGIGNVESIAQ